MEQPDQNKPNTPPACGAGQGTFADRCAPLAFPYIPMQQNDPPRYSRAEALETGTLFPALVELMALDFAVDELGLYLTTHAQDQEALQLYWSYVKLAREGREKYEKMYGPLMQTDLTPEDGYAWLKDPWPWDFGGND